MFTKTADPITTIWSGSLYARAETCIATGQGVFRNEVLSRTYFLSAAAFEQLYSLRLSVGALYTLCRVGVAHSAQVLGPLLPKTWREHLVTDLTYQSAFDSIQSAASQSFGSAQNTVEGMVDPGIARRVVKEYKATMAKAAKEAAVKVPKKKVAWTRLALSAGIMGAYCVFLVAVVGQDSGMWGRLKNHLGLIPKVPGSKLLDAFDHFYTDWFGYLVKTDLESELRGSLKSIHLSTSEQCARQSAHIVDHSGSTTHTVNGDVCAKTWEALTVDKSWMKTTYPIDPYPTGETSCSATYSGGLYPPMEATSDAHALSTNLGIHGKYHDESCLNLFGEGGWLERQVNVMSDYCSGAGCTVVVDKPSFYSHLATDQEIGIDWNL